MPSRPVPSSLCGQNTQIRSKAHSHTLFINTQIKQPFCLRAASPPTNQKRPSQKIVIEGGGIHLLTLGYPSENNQTSRYPIQQTEFPISPLEFQTCGVRSKVSVRESQKPQTRQPESHYVQNRTFGYRDRHCKF
jgi:hypothetical protein